MPNILRIVVFAVALIAGYLQAEPWVDTRDANLRADIEQLSKAGIINSPINTWPLMWSSILEDLDNVPAQDQPQAVLNSYSRVVNASKRAIQINRPSQTVKLALASDPHVIRHYGDSAREEGQLTLRQQGLTQHFAYNLEVNQAQDAWDSDDAHFDNSYLAMVWGNWVLAVGAIDRWWGPAWSSSLILSNNARPTTGFMVQRNYSDPFTLPVLKHLGPWTVSGFISELDDQRYINNAKLLGLTVGFKPVQDLEVNLRRTAQWGGDGRPQDSDNFIKLLIGGADNCSDVACKADEPGNQLGAVDISWHVPIIGTTAYVQTVGEDEAGYFPSRSSRQWGLKQSVSGLGLSGILFLEHDNTSAQSYAAPYNLMYNHSIYQTGYRYRGRAIGATWDNDSKVTSLGFAGYLDNGDGFEFRYSSGEINIDSIDGPTSKHSITTQGTDFSRLSAKWQRSFVWGDVQVGGEYNDHLFDEYGRQSESFSVNASIEYKLF